MRELAGPNEKSPVFWSGVEDGFEAQLRTSRSITVPLVFYAGGGVSGGQVIGASDRNGAYPTADPQTPENFAATIYHALGIPRDATWQDASGRPYHVYQASPIAGLMS